MNFDEFISKYLGKKVDFDGHYGGQCVDLYRQYVQDVLDLPQSPGVGGAAEIWYSASGVFYDFIANGPYDIPEKGDIPVWNRSAGAGFGHVSIFIEGDVNNFTSLDQNWPTLDKVTKTKHNYDNIIGWLRPKKESSADEFGNMVKKSINWDDTHTEYELPGDPHESSLENLKRVVNGIKSRSTDLEKQKNDALNAQKQAEQEIVNLGEKIANIEAKCQRQLDLKNAEISTLSDTAQNIVKLRGRYEGTVTLLEKELREAQKAKGKADTATVDVKAQLEACQKGQPRTKDMNMFFKLLKKLLDWD